MYSYSSSTFYPQQEPTYFYQMPYGMMEAPPICSQATFGIQNNFKTKLCVYFSRFGNCTKMNTCRFAHGVHELQVDPQTIYYPPLPQQVPAEMMTTEFNTFPEVFSSQEPKSSTPDSTYDQNEPNSDCDDGAPQNFKTKLCRHFANSGRCPMKNNCGFAHGPEELQETIETLTKRALNEKYKTKLCDHFAKGGSMDCPYRRKCEFVHRTDKEYVKFYADTEEFNREQQEFKDSVQAQHKRKMFATTDEEEQSINLEILSMVVEWNKRHPRGPHYYDFHGLTVGMAQNYIEDIIESLLTDGVKNAKVETGRGKHSVHGFAAIRALLLTEYQGYNGASFVPEPGNDGVLVLTFPC